MKRVSDILKAKGSEIWAVSPDTLVFDALRLMAEKNIGAVVVARDGELAGIMSERDYARKVILYGKASKDTRVRDIMSEKVVTASPDASLDYCMELMSSRHIRHLPVIEYERLAGVLSIGDVVNAIIGEQQYAIERLRQFHNYDVQ
jgi:CBS domain-containing protein